jgi:hypothetical protein
MKSGTHVNGGGNMIRVLGLLLAVLMLQPLEAAAFLGFGRAKAKRDKAESSTSKIEHRQLAADTEAAFIDLVNQRTAVLEALRVLGRLIEEKQGEKSRIDLYLERRFDVESDKHYRLDTESQRLFRLIVGNDHESHENADVAEDAKAMVPEHVHRELDEQEAKDLMRIARAKRIVQVSIDGLRYVAAQKQRQWNRIAAQLEVTYGIDKDCDYHYDRDTRIIYKLNPASTTAAVPDAGERGDHQ